MHRRETSDFYPFSKSALEDEFSIVLEALLKDDGKQQLFGDNIKKLALPQATIQIVDEIEKLLKK